MTTTFRLLAWGLGLAAAALPVRAQEPLLGELPDGANSTFEVRDVGAEVCRRHAFPAEAMAARMPAGYRLATLSERSSVSWIAELLRRRPDLANHASGSFCFIEAGVHLVNGRPLYPGRRSMTVFLWAEIVPIGQAVTDPRFRGSIRRAQLIWLYDSEGIDRDLALRATPNALFGRVTMERSAEGWRLGIRAGDSVLSARVRPTTERVRLDYPSPGHETIALTDSARDQFYVVTFAGHHEQQAVGEWRASGAAPWARTFEGAASTDTAGSFIQDGWAARLALHSYRQP